MKIPFTIAKLKRTKPKPCTHHMKTTVQLGRNSETYSPSGLNPLPMTSEFIIYEFHVITIKFQWHEGV